MRINTQNLNGARSLVCGNLNTNGEWLSIYWLTRAPWIEYTPITMGQLHYTSKAGSTHLKKESLHSITIL